MKIFKNEIYRLFVSKSTWVVIGILFAMTIVTAIIFSNGQEKSHRLFRIFSQCHRFSNTLAFMISAVYRSAKVSVGISLLLFFTGSAVTQFLASKYECYKIYDFCPF